MLQEELKHTHEQKLVKQWANQIKNKMKKSDLELSRIYEEFKLASVYSDVADFTERLK